MDTDSDLVCFTEVTDRMDARCVKRSDVIRWDIGLEVDISESVLCSPNGSILQSAYCFGASNPNRSLPLFGKISALLLCGLPFSVCCEEFDFKTAQPCHERPFGYNGLLLTVELYKLGTVEGI